MPLEMKDNKTPDAAIKSSMVQLTIEKLVNLNALEGINNYSFFIN